MSSYNEMQKECSACQAVLKAQDKFCRQCGIRQPVQEYNPYSQTFASDSHQLNAQNKNIARADAVTADLITPNTSTIVYETKTLSRPVSTPLLQALARGLAPKQSSNACSHFTRIVLTAIMSAPVWLVIILLSPLDAWTVTKTAMRQV